MRLDSRGIDAPHHGRLRSAATLLMSLPTLVALACFAHGHGTLGASALLGVLTLAVAAGSVGAYRVLSLTRRGARTSDTHPDLGTAAVILPNTK